MGSLYWQLNDCWPVASWSSIDYYGRWKALQYYARRFYSPVLLSPVVEEKDLKFYVVSDRPTTTQATLSVELRDLEGNTLSTIKRDLVVAPVNSKSYFSIPLTDLLDKRDAKNLMVYCELLEQGKVISSNQYFFRPYKELSFPDPQIKFEAVASRNGYKITLTTDRLAKSVYLATEIPGFFSDNYFDLLPGKPVEIEFRTHQAAPLETFRNQLRIRSLKDAFASAGVTNTNQ